MWVLWLTLETDILSAWCWIRKPDKRLSAVGSLTSSSAEGGVWASVTAGPSYRRTTFSVSRCLLKTINIQNPPRQRELISGGSTSFCDAGLHERKAVFKRWSKQVDGQSGDNISPPDFISV